MIDRDGYRPNVAIVLCNAKNQVFWGKRIREHSWQFPQGGIKQGEAPEDAMYRELEEETGLKREHVKILGRTKNWLHYNVPSHWVKREWRGTYKGQKQIWYLLRLTGRDHDIQLRLLAAETREEFLRLGAVRAALAHEDLDTLRRRCCNSCCCRREPPRQRQRQSEQRGPAPHCRPSLTLHPSLACLHRWPDAG